MRIIIASSISGGHLFPAVAVAEELKKIDIQHRILLVTGDRAVARRILEQAGFDYVMLPPFYRPSAITWIPLALRFISNVARSLALLKREQPDVVVGFGGFLSGPVLLSARLLGIPTVIHEQNVVPGRTNRVLAGWVDAVAVSFEGSVQRFKQKDKVVVTGNPVRRSLAAVSREAALKDFDFTADSFTVFIMGGSQGAHAINDAAVAMFKRFIPEDRGAMQVVHITGDTDYEMVRVAYRDLGLRARVYRFMERIDAAYAVADVIVSRSGASALSEIAFLGKTAILVPYPYARSHQMSNARYLAERGSAVLVPEDSTLAERLGDEVMKFYHDRNYSRQFTQHLKGKGEATQQMAELVVNMTKGSAA